MFESPVTKDFFEFFLSMLKRSLKMLIEHLLIVKDAWANKSFESSWINTNVYFLVYFCIYMLTFNKYIA